MDLGQVQMLTAGGVLAILVTGIAANAAYARRELAARRQAPASPVAAGFVGKYAVFEGAVVGKVVAQEDGYLVLEQGGQRRRVPVAAAKESGADVALSQAPEAA